MVKTKGIERSVAGWKSGVAGASGRYTEGINATNDWQEKAVAAEDRYAAGIQQAVANRSREKGLSKVSNSDWKSKAATKGSQRWAPGVNAAEADYRKGLAPVLSVIESVTLPERTNDAAANVAARVTPIAVALQNAKREGRL